MSTAELFKTELETYEKNKAKLLAEGEGKFALIRDGDVAGVWTSYEDALQAGYEKFGLEPFLIKQVESIERIQFITRNIPSCPS